MRNKSQTFRRPPSDPMSSLRDAMVTEAPADFAAAAVSKPIPELPPTTRTRCSFKFFCLDLFFLPRWNWLPFGPTSVDEQGEPTVVDHIIKPVKPRDLDKPLLCRPRSRPRIDNHNDYRSAGTW